MPLNDRGRAQAAQCADILRELFARDGRAPADFDYVSSPLVRASETMDIVRTALGLPPDGYAREPRLAEIAFGEWEGLDLSRRAQARQRRSWTSARATSGCSVPPGGETYEEVARRVGEWYATLDRDTVVTAHGGTARALVGASRHRAAGGRRAPADRAGRGLCVRRTSS